MEERDQRKTNMMFKNAEVLFLLTLGLFGGYLLASFLDTNNDKRGVELAALNEPTASNTQLTTELSDCQASLDWWEEEFEKLQVEKKVKEQVSADPVTGEKVFHFENGLYQVKASISLPEGLEAFKVEVYECNQLLTIYYEIVGEYDGWSFESEVDYYIDDFVSHTNWGKTLYAYDPFRKQYVVSNSGEDFKPLDSDYLKGMTTSGLPIHRFKLGKHKTIITYVVTATDFESPGDFYKNLYPPHVILTHDYDPIEEPEESDLDFHQAFEMFETDLKELLRTVTIKEVESVG